MLRCKVCRSELAQDKDLLSQVDNDFIIEPCEECLKQEELIEDAKQSGYDNGIEDCETKIYNAIAHDAAKWFNCEQIHVLDFLEHIKRVI